MLIFLCWGFIILIGFWSTAVFPCLPYTLARWWPVPQTPPGPPGPPRWVSHSRGRWRWRASSRYSRRSSSQIASVSACPQWASWCWTTRAAWGELASCAVHWPYADTWWAPAWRGETLCKLLWRPPCWSERRGGRTEAGGLATLVSISQGIVFLLCKQTGTNLLNIKNLNLMFFTLF